MWKKITSFLNENNRKNSEKEANTQDVISFMIMELDTAIAKNQDLLRGIRNNFEEIAQKLNFYQQESEMLYAQAMIFVKGGNDKTAKIHLERKNKVDKQVAQFQSLFDSNRATVEKLENQIATLNYQKAEIKSKALIQNAQNEQIGTQKLLLDLGGQSFFQTFDEELAKFDQEIQMTNEFLELNQEVAVLLGNDDLSQLKNEVEKAKLLEKEQKAEQQFRKIALMFGENPNQTTSNTSPQTPIVPKEKILNDFFAAEKSKESLKKENLIENFFTEEKTAEKTDSNEIIEAFFKNEKPKKDDLDKQIDDFFKNNYTQNP